MKLLRLQNNRLLTIVSTLQLYRHVFEWLGDLETNWRNSSVAVSYSLQNAGIRDLVIVHTLWIQTAAKKSWARKDWRNKEFHFSFPLNIESYFLKITKTKITVTIHFYPCYPISSNGNFKTTLTAYLQYVYLCVLIEMHDYGFVFIMILSIIVETCDASISIQRIQPCLVKTNVNETTKSSKRLIVNKVWLVLGHNM